MWYLSYSLYILLFLSKATLYLQSYLYSNGSKKIIDMSELRTFLKVYRNTMNCVMKYSLKFTVFKMHSNFHDNPDF